MTTKHHKPKIHKAVPPKPEMKSKIGKAGEKVVKGAHFAYFGAAAAGAHELYAIAAGVIVVILVAAFFFKIPVEG